MNKSQTIMLCCLLVLSCLFFTGCGSKADENKPVSEVKAEAEKMSAEKLKSVAMTYKEAIMAKTSDVDELAGKLKDIPLTKMMGEEAKSLKSEIETLNKSVSALKERFEIYYNKLKEKGGDLSDLKL